MREYKFDTRSIHSGQKPDVTTGAIMTPIYATSTFVQESPGVNKGYEYSRSGNPTREALEKCMASLENGEVAFAFSSGLAAESTILDIFDAGSHIISSDDLYGGTYRLFSRVKSVSSGMEVSYVDLNNIEEIEKSVRVNTKLIWIETPTNPLLKIVDLEKIAEFAGRKNIITVCDNTFASPYLQNPLDFGIDIVVHSATKYLNGHSDIIAGIVVCKENNENAKKIKYLHNAIGSVLSPFDSFLLLRGLKTLSVRMERHCHNALRISEYLLSHNKVDNVLYPGLAGFRYHEIAKKQMRDSGGMLTFFLKGGVEESRKFLENTRLFSLAESLGGVESLIEHPAIMTHASIPKNIREKSGISDNLIRLSVGIEDVEDLIDDLDNAFKFV